MKKSWRAFETTLLVPLCTRGTSCTPISPCTIAGALTTEGPSETYFLGKSWSGFECPFDGVAIPDSEEGIDEARNEAISYAVYRLMQHRFGETPDGEITMFNINTKMAQLGYDMDFTSTDYTNDGPGALGNYIAAQIIAFGAQDGANEANGYEGIVLYSHQSEHPARNARQSRM
jgi:hypothetical protein